MNEKTKKLILDVLVKAGVLSLVQARNIQAKEKVFYDRLIARGKHVKVARCAAARKLACIAFAIVTKEQMFDPYYHLSQQQQVIVT